MINSIRYLATAGLLLSALPLVGGCSDVESVNALPSDAGTDASAPDGGGGDAGTPKRTVMQRNPFGDVKETQNLLWDGDFEWYSAFSDEYAWLNGPPFDSATFTGILVGAACRSGLKCVSIQPSMAIVGIGVASKGDKIEASFFAAPPGGICSEVRGFVISPFNSPANDPEVEIKPLTKKAAASGWCEYRGVVAARTEKPGLYLKNASGAALGKPAIVDDCVLKVAPKDADLDGSQATSAMDEATRAEIDRARADIARYHKGPHDPPPNVARRALEAWRAPRPQVGRTKP
jgi:hypothetical protein